MRGSWRPNRNCNILTPLLWPSRCVFLVLLMLNRRPRGSLCWVLASFTASYQQLLWTPTQQNPRPLRLGAALPTTSRLQLEATQLSSFCSIHRPYITFKLPRGDMDTPPRLRNFFRYLAIGMYLWNGLCDRHRAEITVMQFRGHSLPVRQSMRV